MIHSPSTRWLAIGIGILIVIGILWAINDGREERSPASTGQSVTGLTLVAEAREPAGEVTLIRDGGESPATDGIALKESDIIRTGAEGSVTLEFFAGSRVALDRDTEVRVDTANVNALNQRNQRVEVTLLGGRAWNRVLQLLEVEATFTARTADLSATVRGTAFAMHAQPGTPASLHSIDLFDGQLGISAARNRLEGTLEAGFTFTDGSGDDPSSSFNPNQPFEARITPTPDDTRNDPWIREQLQKDAEFVERVRALRQRLGDEASYDTIGNEAGPFTLHAGMQHSSFQGVEIRPGRPVTALAAGESLPLDAIATFTENNGTTRQDEITDRATWQLSNTSLATLTRNGVLTATGAGEGTVTIVARWNDGTHEHSDTLLVPIGTVIPPTIETTIETSTSLSF